MSEDRKIIEYDGVKYYKKESKWYQLTPNRSDKISADFKAKKRPIYGFDLAKHKFVEIQPHLYDFELSEQLEQKWIRGIEEQIPTFLTTIQYNTNAIHLETSKDITKTVKEIKFENMFGPRILNEREENNEIYKEEQYFELVNKHNPKIKFSVYIEEDEDEENYLVIIDAVIERI
uniref:Uncharacterized protein n=1 Tax=Meloidogyne javanica TaxID=6303 RepID=A0A915ML67_MELJA